MAIHPVLKKMIATGLGTISVAQASASSPAQQQDLFVPKKGLLERIIPSRDIYVDNYKLPKKGMGEFTAYNPEAAQTDSSPTIMASGKKVYPGAIATSDYSIPFGTKIYSPQLKKTFIVEDRMNRRYSPEKSGKQHFDILLDDKQQAKEFGRQQLNFHVLQ